MIKTSGCSSWLPSEVATPGHGPGLGPVVQGVAGGAVDLHVGALAAGGGVQLPGAVYAAEAVLVVAAHAGDHPLGLEHLRNTGNQT